jgi:tripartite-type tricarboxylate transporter receptor subunit TctC
MIESGFPGFVSDTFNALFAPAGVPKDIIDKLSKESRAAMQRPEVRDAARRAGYEIVAGTPEQLGARLVSEIRISKELAEKAGVKAE